ncbi:hypothetical protein [Chromobacterium phragmitis]|uniref:hypothetical protein n=1 Tax=Chromobacterium phragmitis TaxID=2202141 RepID=UPI003262E623
MASEDAFKNSHAEPGEAMAVSSMPPGYFDQEWGDAFPAADMRGAEGGMAPRGVHSNGGIAPERMALLQRVAQEARGESASAAEAFDMGYSEDISFAAPEEAPGGDVAGDVAREHQSLPEWARVAIKSGMLGRDSVQMSQCLDALGLVDGESHAAHAAASWPVPALHLAFSDLAAVAVSARGELPAFLRMEDRLGGDGYFFMRGEHWGKDLLIVADASRGDASDQVRRACDQAEAERLTVQVVALSSHVYAWALRRFLWQEIVEAGEVAHAVDICDAFRVYAATAGWGRRLLLQESAYGLEPLAVADDAAARELLGRLGAVHSLNGDALWLCEPTMSLERKGKAAPLSAFGLTDRVAIDRLLAELTRPGAIVFVSGSMAWRLTASLLAEAWRGGVPAAYGEESAIAGVATVLANPDADCLRGFSSPVIAVYPSRQANAESALMFLLGERPEWAKGRVLMGVNTRRVPALCPICANPVDAEQAARELTEVVNDFRGASFERVRTRNTEAPCCGTGYAGEVWLSEVWDGRVFQKEIGLVTLGDLVEKGLRQDQRISAKLLQAIQAGTVDYRLAGGAR